MTLRPKLVRISQAPEYYPDVGGVSGNYKSSRHPDDEDEDNELMYNFDNAEDDRKESVKSVTKITSIFESIQEWKIEDIPRSFAGATQTHYAILEASWKGELNLLEEALNNMKPNQMKIKLNCKDSEGRTPLILASAFGNSQVVQFLVQNGADVNIWDKRQKATPLACAAACGNSSILSILLAHGAIVDSADLNNKTPLFWAVQSGSFSCVKKLLEAGAQPNRNVKTVGTPLHVASSLSDEDALPIMEILIEFQASARIVEETTHRTPLHFATEEGNVECMDLLLKVGSACDAIDVRGFTPLHIAASNFDYEALEVLLSNKADPNITDVDGRTPLHRVISKDSRAAECLIYLLDNGAEVDAQDSFGHTPLHLAVLNDSAQIVGILLKYGSDITLRTKAGKDSLSLIVRRMPHVIRYIKESLDNAISILSSDPNDPQCRLKLDFRPIIANSQQQRDQSQSIRKNGDGREVDMHRESEFISCLIKTGHKSLISHPLIEAFIVLKWERVRRFFLASLIFHTIMVLLYTTFVLLLYVYLCPYQTKKITSMKNDGDVRADINKIRVCDSFKNNSEHGDGSEVYCEKGDHLSVKVVWALLILITIFVGMKELFQIIQECKQYFKSLEHWGQWLLLINIVMAVWPVPMAYECLLYWHYPSAAIGIFIAWTLMLVRVAKFPLFGVYIQMLMKVVKNFGLFITAYACLLIAFVLAFCILFPDEPTFTTPWRSLLTVIVMLAGELNYDELFHNDKSELAVQYPLTAQIMFGCFVLVITVILMNLLVGLAVSDIQSLREGAKLDRLSRQTNSISQLESFLFSRGLQAFLPDSIGTILRRSALLVPSSYRWIYYFRPHDPRDNWLPVELQQDCLRLATTKQFSRKPSNRLRKRTARGSKWLSKVSNVQQNELENLQKVEEKLLNSLKKEMGNGFERINQKIDEMFLQLKKK